MADVRWHLGVLGNGGHDVLHRFVRFVVSVKHARRIVHGGNAHVEIGEIAIVNARPVVSSLADDADQSVGRVFQQIADDSTRPAVDNARTDNDRAHALAVGARGTILRYDGESWRPMTSPESRDLRAVRLLDGRTQWRHSLDGASRHAPAALAPAAVVATLADGRVVALRLDTGEPIYARKLSIEEVKQRIVRYHQPYQKAVKDALDRAHRHFGVVWHLNCHSMPAVSSRISEEGPGRLRADFVLGDRDGTSCGADFTAFVHSELKTWAKLIRDMKISSK